MEVKAFINKPYTKEQRIDFIIQYNRNLGYQIEERQDKLVALGYTEEEKQEIEKQNKITEIDYKISELNNESLEYMRKNDTKGLEVINSIINGLEETKISL